MTSSALSADRGSTSRPGHHGQTTKARLPPLSVDEAATYLSVSGRFIRRLVAERRIRYYKIGKYVRFNPEDLDEFMSAGRRDPTSRGR